MTRFVLRRLLYGLAILVGVNLFTFVLFFSVNTPDDMARLNIGGKRVTQAQIEQWKTERGYDKPLYFDASRQGLEQLTHTILWERSVSLFALEFGKSDARQAVNIGHEIKPCTCATLASAKRALAGKQRWNISDVQGQSR